MSIFVFNTEQVEKDSKKFGCVEALKNLQKRIEESQSISFLDTFPPPYLVKKKFGNSSGRLIGKIENIKIGQEEHSIIVFIKVLQRSGKEYDDFINNLKEYGAKLEASSPTYSELMKFVEERLRKDPPKQKDLPSESEYCYLNAPAVITSLDNEDMICETQCWVEKMLLNTYNAKLTRIFDALGELVENQEKGSYNYSVKNTDMTLHAVFYPEYKIWFLTDITVAGEEYKAPNLDEKLGKLGILKQTFRAYPQYMLAGEEIWHNIEKDPLGNYSLSEEETEILNSVASVDNKGFPLFINGRAGSGKSTILQYIYTDYLSRYLSNKELTNPPVYFASNPQLLSQAKQLVKSILKSNTNYSISGNLSSEQLKDLLNDEKINTLFNKSFKEYREYLLSKIPLAERNLKFANEKYINYSRFREWWQTSIGNQQNASKNYGPDLSWHVIRTYIKGTSMEDYLERDDYIKLDDNQKSVSNEAYQLIYDKVWTNNYSDLRNDGFWDDQDLARYVLDNNLIKPEIPGIFCDEAQDFTKIELETFLRMSLFSNRKIMPHEMPKIPFVFAGDEFQTLNPTGFKWDSVKALFTEKFIMAVNPSATSNSNSKNKQSINYRVLSNNYRSASAIVGFCNFIQLLRMARFNLTGVTPQKEWNSGNEVVPVVSYTSDSKVFWDGIKNRAADTVFIVPANEENILDYIRNDSYLSVNIPIDEARNVPQIPVLNPVMAKGLEYPCVVIYGFGAVCDDKIFDWPNTNKVEEAYSQRLALEYFLNKVYVAASRPRKQLYILDTPEGMDKLWKFATDPIIEQQIINRCNKYDDWKTHISHLSEGTIANMNTDSKVNLSDTAGQLEASGIASKNSFPLKTAARLYSDAKKFKDANRCEALAAEYDGNFEKAAEFYKKENYLEDALRCLWLQKDKGWAKIVELCEGNFDFIMRIEYIFSQAITSKKNETIIAAIDALAKQLASDKEKEILINTEVLDYNLKNIMKLLQVDASSSKKSKNLFENLNIIMNSGLSVDKHKLAQIAYNYKLYEDAIQIWEEIDDITSVNYYRAKAKTSVYPDSLTWLYRAKAWNEIAESYKSNPSFENYTNDQYITLIRAFIINKKKKLAASFLPKLQQSHYYEQLYKNSNDYGISSDWLRNLEEAINLCALRDNNFKEIWDKVFITNGRPPALRPKLVAKAIARLVDLGSYLPNTGATDQPCLKGISDFLSYYFLGDDKRSKKYDPEVGAAFELTKNYSYSQQYYQLAPSSDTMATERMIYSMEKHAKIYEKEGKIPAAEKILKEASLLRRSNGIDDSYVIPDLPNLNRNWSTLFDFLFDEQEAVEWSNQCKKMEQSYNQKLEAEKQMEALKKEQEKELKREVLKKLIDEKTSASKKFKNNPEFSSNGFSFRYKASAHRLNIEREEDGMSCSIIKGKEIKGDFETEDYSDNANIKRIKDTDILITFIDSEKGKFSIKFINEENEYQYEVEE